MNDIDKILHSLDGIKRAEAKPYMHTRIMARLKKDEESFWARSGRFITRPVIAVSCLLVVLVVNYVAIHRVKKVQDAIVVSGGTSETFQENNFVLAVNNYALYSEP